MKTGPADLLESVDAAATTAVGQSYTALRDFLGGSPGGAQASTRPD